MIYFSNFTQRASKKAKVLVKQLKRKQALRKKWSESG